MYLIYTPDGDKAQEQRWTFALGKLRSKEIEQIEKLTGLQYGVPYKQALLQGGALARRALLWTFLRRQHPTTRFNDVDFADDELELDMDRAEWIELRDEVESSTHMDQATKEQALAQIDKSIAEADEEPGKAPSSSSESGTPSP